MIYRVSNYKQWLEEFLKSKITDEPKQQRTI